MGRIARRPILIATTLAALATVGVGVAHASIPGSGQTYTGCFFKNTGTLRLIDPSLGSRNPLGYCSNRETRVTWNQKGQPGAQGPAGPAGAAGATGATGLTGPPGPAGAGVTVTFAFGNGTILTPPDALKMVASKHLDGGSYAVAATANIEADGKFAGSDAIWDHECELHNGSGTIGGATDRREIPTLDKVKISLSMNGGAQVPLGGGDVSLWCRSQGAAVVTDAQIMIIKVAGFF
jgi:hypothetical protein